MALPIAEQRRITECNSAWAVEACRARFLSAGNDLKT